MAHADDDGHATPFRRRSAYNFILLAAIMTILRRYCCTTFDSHEMPMPLGLETNVGDFFQLATIYCSSSPAYRRRPRGVPRSIILMRRFSPHWRLPVCFAGEDTMHMISRHAYAILAV